MKVLFLDFDGVLNNDNHFRKVKNHEPAGPTAFHHKFDPKNIAVLNTICKKVPNLKIVISSSWRLGCTLAELKDILKSANFEYVDRVIDATPIHAHGPRGEEIQVWLDNQEAMSNFWVSEFVILDDDEDMAHLSNRLVRTRFRYGLQEKHTSEILKILKETS